MYEAAISGLVQVVQWPAPLYLFIGILIGLFFGAVPGLGGLTALAILLPFSFTMQPVPAFALLVGMYAVVTTGDNLSSILLGVPGTAASQATILDGYPLALQGEAARALGAAYTVSAIGGVLSAIVLALSIPIIQPLVLAFASPEFFMLALLGLTMVGAVSGNSMVKGLASAALGALLATVGYSIQGSVPRYTFGAIYLFDGMPLVPLVLGLFAIPELLSLATRGGTIAETPRGELRSGIMAGVRDSIREYWLVLRCTVIGVYIGMLPGIGGSVVDWIAYAHALQTAKDKSRFGKGDIRGVIAPEAANNAMKGGTLIPTIAFAIPGNASTAVLLGAFTIQGLRPGPSLLTTHLDFTFSLVWTLAIANIIGALLLMVWGKQAAKVTVIPGHLLIPAVIPILFMGAWMTSSRIGDWIVLVAFGALGFVMRRADWPRPPLILGLLLGGIMEENIQLTVESYGPVGWLTRPIVMVLIAILVLTVLFAVRRAWLHRESGNEISTALAGSEEGGLQLQRKISIGFGGLLAATFIFAIAKALGWRELVGAFPLAVAAPGLVFTLWAFGKDIVTWRRHVRAGATPASQPTNVERLGPGFYFLLWLTGILVLTVFIGQVPALLIFVAAYLWLWGKYSWRLILPFTAIVAGVVYLMFEQLVPVVWYRPLLF